MGDEKVYVIKFAEGYLNRVGDANKDKFLSNNPDATLLPDSVVEEVFGDKATLVCPQTVQEDDQGNLTFTPPNLPNPRIKEILYELQELDRYLPRALEDLIGNPSASGVEYDHLDEKNKERFDRKAALRVELLALTNA